MQKKLEYLVFSLVGLSFFVPLIVLKDYFIFPFIVPKILALRSVVVLLTTVWAFLLAMNWQRYKIKFTVVSLFVFLFFLSFFISTFAGVDWYKSFWDNHERMLGLFTIAHYVLLYFVATSTIKQPGQWLNLLRIFLFAGTIVMFVALRQQIQPDYLLNQGSNRSVGTLGNAIYVGGYGLFLLYLGALLFLEEKKIAWKVYSVIGAIFGFCGILASGTRGTLVGLGVGLIFLCVYYAVNKNSNKKLRMLAAALLAFLAVFTSLLFTFRQTEFVQKIPAIGRLANTTLSSDTAGTRIMAWEIAWESWKAKPVFGWGPNNYFYAFNQYYKPQFLESGYGETWFDNAHNIIMNTLCTQGIVGILIYLGLFVAVIGWMINKNRKGQANIHLVALCGSFLVAHLVQNVFVFENPTSYLYFFFFLAYINYRFTAESGIEHGNSKEASKGFMVAVAIISLIIIYSTDVNPGKANTAVLQSIQKLYLVSPDAGSSYEEAAKIQSPHKDDIRSDFSRTVVDKFGLYYQGGQKDEAKQLALLAKDELNKNLLLHPLDIRVHIVLTQVDQMLAVYFNDYNAMAESESLMQTALKLSPQRQQIQYMLSGIELALGKKQEAESYATDALNADRKIGESWWRLAMVYAESGDLKKAINLIAEAKSKGIVFNTQGEGVVNNILSRGQSATSAGKTSK